MPKKHFWIFAGISPKQFQLFSQKPIFWTFQLFLSNRTLWDAIKKILTSSVLLKFFKEFFEKNIIFSRNSKFLTFRPFSSNNSFWVAFYLKSALFSGFEKFQLRLHWNLSLFPKNPWNWPLGQFLINITL